jgi:ribosomal protein S18 acetylase RimI-like enzyme
LHDVIAIPSPAGLLRLRPERPEDRDFRFELFCNSRLPEWYVVQIDPTLRDQLMRHQFHAQTVSYAQMFPKARFDIVELDGERIGRIVVDRPGDHLHIIDQAVVPEFRNQGIGTAMMRFLMDEAAAAGIPVRLEVADANDPSLKLYLRLGFAPIRTAPFYIELEWPAPAVAEAGASAGDTPEPGAGITPPSSHG